MPLGRRTQTCLVAATLFLDLPLPIVFPPAQRATLIDGVAQHQQHLGHLADLIATVTAGDLHRCFFGGNRVHRCLQPGDRRRDAAHDGIGDRDRGGGAKQAEHCGPHRILAIERGKIIRIDTGADDPAPGLKTGDIGILQHRLVGARLRPKIIDEALAVLLHLVDELNEQELARRILHLGDIGAVQLRLDRVHHHGGTHVVDPEITVGAVAHRADHVLGGRLRLFAGHRARLFHLVIFVEDAERRRIHLRQPRLPLRFQLGIGIVQKEDHRRRKHGKRESDEAVETGGNLDVAHEVPGDSCI